MSYGSKKTGAVQRRLLWSCPKPLRPINKRAAGTVFAVLVSAVTLCLVLLIGAFLPAPAFIATAFAASTPASDTSAAALPTEAELSKLQNDLAAYELKTVPSPAPGQVKGDWTVFALSRAGKLTAVVKKNYLENLKTALPAYFDGNGKPVAERFTDYARVSLALVSVDVNPRDLYGADFIAPLETPEDNLKQGANGPAFALLALDSAGFATPNPAVRAAYVDWLLAHQSTGGGWNLAGAAGQPANPDVTSFVLQALAPYAGQAGKNGGTAASVSGETTSGGTSGNGSAISVQSVSEVADRAFVWLSGKQSPDGGFGTLESAAQVIVALNAYGIAVNDPRFVKEGHTAYDALMQYYLPEAGAFRVSLSEQFAGSPDPMSTDQGFYAINAFYRSVAGQPALYRITTVAELKPPGGFAATDMIRIAVFAAVALALIAVSRRLLPKKETEDDRSIR